MDTRDEFTKKAKRVIAARVGFRCSRPDCQAPTAGPTTDTAKFYNVGVAAHITAAAAGGPRFDKNLTPEERKHPDNGIWLCQTHGKEVDGDAAQFPVDLLKTWKREAESRARGLLGKATTTEGTQGPAADVSKGQRYGLEAVAVLEDGREIPLAVPFDVSIDKPTFYAEASFVIRFLLAKREGVIAILIDGLRATVYGWSPLPKFKTLAYALPVLVNPYVVNLKPPLQGKPRTCIAELFFHDDLPGPIKFSPILVKSDVPEVIDVRFNASQPGIYTVALDVVVVRGIDKQTYRVLDPTDVLFLNSYSDEDANHERREQ